MSLSIEYVSCKREELRKTWELKFKLAAEGNNHVITQEVIDVCDYVELLYYAEIGLRIMEKRRKETIREKDVVTEGSKESITFTPSTGQIKVETAQLNRQTTYAV